MIYREIAFLALTVVYIVDVSGFTQSWRALVARIIGTTEGRLRPLPPFDCGTCAVWWACLVLVICRGELSMATVAACSLASLLAQPAGQLMLLLREGMLALIGKCGQWMQRI